MAPRTRQSGLQRVAATSNVAMKTPASITKRQRPRPGVPLYCHLTEKGQALHERRVLRRDSNEAEGV